jgi:excisionase family DNA binding protein
MNRLIQVRMRNSTKESQAMAKEKDQPVLLTVREVSILLRVQRPKVYELIRDGAVEGFKVGADWRVRRDSIETLIGAIPAEFFKKHRGMKDEEQDDAPAEMSSRPQPAVLRG